MADEAIRSGSGGVLRVHGSWPRRGLGHRCRPVLRERPGRHDRRGGQRRHRQVPVRPGRRPLSLDQDGRVSYHDDLVVHHHKQHDCHSGGIDDIDIDIDVHFQHVDHYDKHNHVDHDHDDACGRRLRLHRPDRRRTSADSYRRSLGPAGRAGALAAHGRPGDEMRTDRRAAALLGLLLISCGGGEGGSSATSSTKPTPSTNAVPLLSLPTSTSTTRAPATTQATTATTRTTASTPAPTSPPVTSVSYANCAAVRAAGKAPLRRGDPGYSTSLDRDGDGIACET